MQTLKIKKKHVPSFLFRSGFLTMNLCTFLCHVFSMNYGKETASSSVSDLVHDIIITDLLDSVLSTFQFTRLGNSGILRQNFSFVRLATQGVTYRVRSVDVLYDVFSILL
jgi:hypothetical protein